MVCQGCFRLSQEPLCRVCSAGLRPASDRLLPGGVRAIAGFDHTGVAARLVHALKYRGQRLIVRLVTSALEPRLEEGLVFVPIPRVWTRYLRYGVDPSAELATALARATSGSVALVLRRAFHSPRRAGSRRRGPAARMFARSGLQGSFVVVDDVLTTGATAAEAMRSLLPGKTELVVTATSARQVSSLFVPGTGSHRAGAREQPAGDFE